MEVSFFDEQLERFIGMLEPATVAKVLRTVDLLVRFGHQLGMPHSKRVGSHLLELRVRGQQEVRIFYTFHRNAAVLLYGFIKKSQATPARELATARRKLGALDKI